MVEKISGVIDPFQEGFTPDVWTPEGKLRPGIKPALLAYIKRILGYPLTIFNVVNMIGSTLTYQYTSHSDIDLSLGLKPEYDHLLPELHLKCKNSVDTFVLPGTEHPVNLFVSPSVRKLRPESLSGGYDLINNVWIKVPKKPTVSDRRRYDMIMPYMSLQRNEMKRQMRQLLQRGNLKEAWDVANLFGVIDRNRKIAYDFPAPMGGNYSTQNAAFKYTLKGQEYALIDKLYNKLRERGLTFSE